MSWKKLLIGILPSTIQAAETIFSKPGQGPTKLGIVTGLAQNVLLAAAGTTEVTHEEAANIAAIQGVVQSVVTLMKNKGGGKIPKGHVALTEQEVTPILDQN